MAAHYPYCKFCKENNCKKHSSRVETLTDRLKELLEHFEEPDAEMRTYIDPDKTKGKVNATQSSPRSEALGKTFSDDSLKSMASVMGAPKSVPMPRSEKPPVTTTAIVHVGTNTTSSTNTSSNTNSEVVTKLAGARYRAHEKHHFVKINACSFVSCSSPSGLYSELAVVLWVDNKTYAKYSTSTERYRVVLSLLYDAEEDLWCVSAKLLKRTSYYSNKDEEEGHISNRLCTVGELRSDIKKMLLYLGISPREAYRLFRKNMEEKLIVADSGSGFTTVETESHTKLLKELEKPPTSSTYNHYDHHGYAYGYGTHRQHHPTFPHLKNSRDTDVQSKSAMFGMYESEFGE